MDKLSQHRAIVKRVLQEYADFENRALPNELESHLIIDEVHDRYMLFRVGWRDKYRIHTPVLYLHLKNDKIWIEEDQTEDGIATDLLRANISTQDIVLAFHHPDKRPYTEFAAA
jgi:hypothetical protein